MDHDTDLPAGEAGPQGAPPPAPDARAGRIGVLLLNLGTPDATDYWSMRRYLSEFLSDRRVIETSRAIWYPVLHGIVLTTRPGRSGANYDRIWNREEDESPFRTITRSQAERLSATFASDPRIVVDWAMRYGTPSVEDVLGRMTARGCDRILAVPLYPQYSASTTATANDQLYRALMKLRYMPAVRSAPPYYADPAYIEALARSVEQHLATLSFAPELVVASYHGLPQSYADKGDPYPTHCLETSRLLCERLGWPAARVMTTFQSRFGNEVWLQPYTDETVQKLARDGVKSISVINPGFSADCLETLDEIGREVRDEFLHAGGKNFSHIPCLNDSDEGMSVIEAIARRELSGWL